MNYLYTIAGAFLMALSIQQVLEPMELVTGGVSGIAIMVKSVTGAWFGDSVGSSFSYFQGGIPLWITTVVINVPLFWVAYKKLDRGVWFRNLFGSLCLIFFLAVLPKGDLLSNDYMLNAVFGGLMEGTGLGLVLLSKASTGGVDLLATLLLRIFPQYSIPKIMMVLDGIIIGVGILLFGIERGLYALIVIFCVSRISDVIIGGFAKSLVAYIISDQSDGIANEIMEELERGITGISVTGLYHNKNRTMLMCATGKKQLVYVKEIVAKYDSNAFVIIVDARETLGEGFQGLGNYIR
ncbi:MAG: YitT family protein [Lachnospira sp.]|nr:YitT family protein [Lachnospira sp.]